MTTPITPSLALIAGVPAVEKNTGKEIPVANSSNEVDVAQVAFLPALVAAMANSQQQPTPIISTQDVEVVTTEVDASTFQSGILTSLESPRVDDGKSLRAEDVMSVVADMQQSTKDTALDRSSKALQVHDSGSSSVFASIEQLPVEAQMTLLQDTSPEFHKTSGEAQQKSNGSNPVLAATQQVQPVINDKVEPKAIPTDAMGAESQKPTSATAVSAQAQSPSVVESKEKSGQPFHVDASTIQFVDGKSAVSSLQDVRTSFPLGKGEQMFLYQTHREAIGDTLTRQETKNVVNEMAKGDNAAEGAQGIVNKEQGNSGEKLPSVTVPTLREVVRPTDKSSAPQSANAVASSESDAIDIGNGVRLQPVPLIDASTTSKIVPTKPGLKDTKQTDVPTPKASEGTVDGATATGPKTNAVLPANGESQTGFTGSHQHTGGQISEHMRSTANTSADSMKTEFVIDTKAVSSLVLENITAKFSNEIVGQLRDGISEVRMMLKPESLGELSLKIRIEDDVVTAQIQVAHPEVKAALEASAPQLREALANRGIEVHTIDIFTAADAQSREFRGEHNARQKSNPKRRENVSAEEQYKGTKLMGYNTIDIVM